MKFYFLILAIFAAFILGVAALQRLTPAARNLARMETMAQAFIKQHARDPSSLQYHGHELIQSSGSHFYLLDFTATNGLGGPTRERWTFEFDPATQSLVSVKPENAPLIKLR